MKVAVIGQKGIPSRAGGVEIHVEEIAARLSNNEKNQITVYCRKNYCEKEYVNYRGINIKYIKSINSKHLDAITYTFLSTIDAIKSGHNLIHYHALGPSLLAFIPRIFRKRVVCTCHGLDWQREKWGKTAKAMLKSGEFIGSKFANEYIVVSKSLVDYYKQKYNRNVIYIPNGIEEKHCLQANNIKKKFNLDKNEYILFLARLVPEKGAHYLIDAFNSINTNKKLVIAGGSSHSDEYVDELKNKASNNKNIIFTDFVKGETLDELYSNAYCYVLPSEIEGLPISLLEAMAYGQCCLVSDIEQNTDVIESYGESFINKNIKSLKEKLKYLIENPNVVDMHKERSKDFILKKYNWDDVAITTEETLRRAMTK
ncbi:glycosyltransferase family 4 protein [Romboutsia lituseburensis]|uniref:glycosyltransferase family 4 protein n=1 Tax=Romboutsia lituseburensis TaxID=1537 RepID=UPI00215AC7A6|nr:glycosyltransferase family 4 protein [Romboutsia lituseburensis]MCR8746792.1 glycosyltransferase family 4 protein [Romboutsia lituseburensis]